MIRFLLLALDVFAAVAAGLVLAMAASSTLPPVAAAAALIGILALLGASLIMARKMNA